MRAMNQEPFRGVRRTSWAVVRQTYGELLSTTIKTWKEWFPERLSDGSSFCTITYSAPPHARVNIPLGDGTIMDMEVLFLCLDKPEDVSKFNSLEITGAWINEARYIDMKFLPDILARTGRFPQPKDVRCTWRGIIMDTNPPEVDSDYYKLAEVDRPEGYEFFRQPPALLEVPASEKEPAHYIPNQGQGAYPPAENIEHLPDGFYYYLDQVSGADREWIHVHLMGEYGTVQYGKPVFGNQFLDSLHVSKVILEPYASQMLLVGQDFGFAASVFAQVSNNGQIRILDEMFADETTGAQQYGRDFLLPRLRSKYAGLPFSVICDPSGNSKALSNESACMEEFQKLGIPCQEARTNLIQPRLEAVRKLLLANTQGGQPKFLMSPNCANLRKAFQKGYHYREVNTASGKQMSAMPAKNHPQSDLCLCKGTRITMADGTEMKIEEVQADMEVLTPDGPCRVIHAWISRRDAEIMELITQSGHCLGGTPDHPIWTRNNPKKRLDSLEYSDVLLCINTKKEELWGSTEYGRTLNVVHAVNSFLRRCGDSIKAKRSFVPSDVETYHNDAEKGLKLTVSGSERDLTITNINVVTNPVCGYTDICGNVSTDQFQQKCSSAIKTEIHLTIPSKIFRSWKAAITCLITARNVIRKILIAAIGHLRLLGKPQRLGTDRQKGLHGTDHMLTSYGMEKKKKNLFASIAEKLTRASNTSAKGGSVLRPVSLTPDGKAVWTTKIESVQCAGSYTASTITQKLLLVETRIVGKRLCPDRRDVYDLTVEGSHCFFANGILVHNCDCTEYLAMELDGGLTYGGPVGSGQFFGGGQTKARPIVRKSAGAFL
jgi:hypothetical protein